MKLLLLCLLGLCAAVTATDDAKIQDLSAAVDAAVEMFESPAAFNDDAEIAKRGLQAARDFIEIFNSDIFKKKGDNGEDKNPVKKVAEIVSKIFSFVISILNLIFGILGGESPELKFMREQFKEVHAKLDSISLQLDDVKRLVEWQTTRVMYARYESFIGATTHLLDSYIVASEGSRDVLKRQFMTAFQLDPMAPLKLYQAIVETDFVVSTNLAAAVVHYTQNYRRHVINFLLAMQRTIMRGAQLEIAYEKMAHGDGAAAVTKSIWDGRMEKLLERMQKVETDVKNRFQSQMESDVDRVILDNRGLSNRDFSGHMYNFLAGKFDWRYWFSLAYKDVSGFNVHTISYCGGSHRFRTHGSRNVVAASADPDATRFNQAKGNAALDAAQREGSGNHAEAWVNLLRNKVGHYCEDAAFVGAICWGCDVWFTMRGDRYVYRKMSNGGDINTILFG